MENYRNIWGEIERCRRRDGINPEFGAGACFHVAYDDSRKRLESLSNQELIEEINYHRAQEKFEFWQSRYLPSLGYAGMNALVDLSEERGLIPRVK